MRIDLPLCSFKDCRYNFDGNCKDEIRKEKCEFDRYKSIAEEQSKIGEWIPCSERMPEETKSYIVTRHIPEREYNAEKYDVCMEKFWEKENVWDCERYPACEWKVVAWIPSLAPYEVKSDE